MKNILEFPPVRQFIETIGKDIQAYLGKDPAAIVCLLPDGTFYGVGLYEWLTKKRKNIILLSMDDDADDLDEQKVKGRKVLLVDNDIVTGKGYKRAMEAMRVRKSRLGIKDIKFATFFDRVGVADFSVERYSPEALWHMKEFDALDLKIIRILAQNGRTSNSSIAKKAHLSAVSVKNRIDRLLREKVLKIQGVLNINQFYTMSAHIQIEANEKTVDGLIEKLEKHQEVYHLAKKISGRYNLLVGILGNNLESIDDFVEREVRIVSGVNQIDVHLGEVPILPKTVFPKL